MDLYLFLLVLVSSYSMTITTRLVLLLIFSVILLWWVHECKPCWWPRGFPIILLYYTLVCSFVNAPSNCWMSTECTTTVACMILQVQVAQLPHNLSMPTVLRCPVAGLLPLVYTNMVTSLYEYVPSPPPQCTGQKTMNGFNISSRPPSNFSHYIYARNTISYILHNRIGAPPWCCCDAKLFVPLTIEQYNNCSLISPFSSYTIACRRYFSLLATGGPLITNCHKTIQACSYEFQYGQIRWFINQILLCTQFSRNPYLLWWTQQKTIQHINIP